MKNPLEESKELVEQGLGTIQQIYVGGSEFETWFIYIAEWKNVQLHFCFI